MKQFIRFLFLIFFLLFFSNLVFCQQFNLDVKSSIKKDSIFISKIDFEKSHQSEEKIKEEINKISSYLKNDGYFLSRLDSIVKKEKKYFAFFTLREQTTKAIILVPKGFEYNTKPYLIKNDSLYINPSGISSLLKNISNRLDEKGKSFSKVFLSNIIIKEKTLIAHLNIKNSKKRFINDIIIKPYSNFPKSFLKNYLNINHKKEFSQNRLKEISSSINQLNFIKQLKKPEILFTKDSTLLYLYVDKKQNNTFDGIINFATKENGAIELNGNIDLKLNNIFNKGELFSFIYNSATNELQDLKVLAEVPYIFNSKFSPSISFNIFKQDSTFLSTNLNAKINYSLNKNSKIFFSYNSDNSNHLSKDQSASLDNFRTNFYGLGYSFVKKKINSAENKITFLTNVSLGNRFSKNTSNQLKIDLETSYLIDFNFRSTIYLNGNIGLLNSDNLLTNELFRIGGANSIRGFDEQSIYTSRFYYLNTEYRYLTNKDSYIFSVTDIGNIKNTKTNTNEYLLGLGLGYSFISGNNNFNISYVLGKLENEHFDAKNSKIIIKWVTLF